MSEVSLALAEFEGIPQLKVAGEIDLASAPRLDEMLSVARERSPGSLIVSLQRCDYCDSTGLSVLIRHAKEVQNFCLVVPPESHLRKIFRLTNLEEPLGVVDTMADAMRRMRKLSAA